MGIKSVVLENKPYSPLLRRELGDILLAEIDFTACGSLKTAYHIQSGALSAAGGSQQSYELTVGQLEVEVINSDHLLRFFSPAWKYLCEIL